MDLPSSATGRASSSASVGTHARLSMVTTGGADGRHAKISARVSSSAPYRKRRIALSQQGADGLGALREGDAQARDGAAGISLQTVEGRILRVRERGDRD